MDRLINNEALISCVIATVIELRPCSVSLVTALIPVLLNDTVRKKIAAKQRVSNRELQRVGMSYKDLLVPVMNSILILKEGRCLYIDKGMLYPTPLIMGLTSSINNNSRRLNDIISDINTVMEYLTSQDITKTFKKLYISL